MWKEDYHAFNTRIAGILEFVAETLKPAGIKYTITSKAPPTLSVIPFSRKKIAAVSVYKENTIPVHSLIDADGCYGAYRVTEALPVAYTKNWPDGEPTPGACLLTLFSKRKDIDHPTFIDRWHNSHTPLSLRYHPLWNYNRNVVKEKITEYRDWYDGIVEEQTRTRAELLNPVKFFGKPHKILQNMLAVYTDTKSFLDYKRIETYLAAEYIILE